MRRGFRKVPMRRPHEDPYIFLGPFSNSPLAKFFERRNCNLRIQGLSERIQGFRFATDNVHETDKKEGGGSSNLSKILLGGQHFKWGRERRGGRRE